VLFLEEADLAHELRTIDTRKGEQHTPGAHVAALKDRHSFKTEMDANARRHIFPHTIRAPA
jgi:hypothetical protein